MDNSLKICLGLLITMMHVHIASAQYKIYEKGFESYKAGKYNDAVSYFSEYFSKPTRQKNIDVEAYYLRGLSYYKTNDYNKAIGDFQETLLNGHPNKGNIYWFLAKSLDTLGFYPDAILAYTSAIKEMEGNKENLVKLFQERSHTYMKSGDSGPAYNDLVKAYEIQPGNTDIKRDLAKFGRDQIIDPVTRNEPVTEKKQVSSGKDPSLADLYKDEKRYALVIGNSKYPKEVGELRNPVNDAIDMAEELRRCNFDVQLLTNATYGQIRAAMLTFKEKTDASDRDKTVALFYFAGHGLRHEDENYLVPVDALIQYEDDIVRYCFPVQRMVLGNMERSNTRMNIVILDACRNNPYPSLTRSGGQQGLGEMKKARGSFIAFSTAPGSVASDGTGRNGLYTQELLKALRRPNMTIEQVFKDVRLNVLRLSGEQQNTWDNSNIIGEFYFNVN